MSTLLPTTVPSKRLAASITGATMTLQLTDIVGWDGNNLTSSDFGSVLYAVLRNDSNTAMELIELDPTTIANSSITINRRGLSFTGDLTTEVAANKLTWVKNATIVELGADTPQLFQWLKQYIDAAAIAGAVNASTTVQGLVELATQAEVVAKTATGGTGAALAVTPDKMPSVLLSDYKADTGSANAYAIAPSPAITTYTTGQIFSFKAANANTTASTLNVNSLGTKTIKKLGGTLDLTADDIVAGQVILVEYDGTNFQLLSNPGIQLTPPGMISPYAGRSAPTGWLLCDGSAVSRTTYANLLAAIAPSGTFTVTIASPGVFSKTGHGLVVGDKLHFTTTGGLPSGLATNTDYFVISAGLTADAFEVAITPGGAAVNTSGSQSGVHTLYAGAWGKGDGSTTFNVPDLRSKSVMGRSASAPTTTLTFEPASVSTGNNEVTIPDYVYPSQGQAVVLTTTGTLPAGLSLATTYYIYRASSTTVKFCATLSDASGGAGVGSSGTIAVIDITDQGTGIHTMTFTNRAHTVLGLSGGEETHGLTIGEMPSHKHTLNNDQGTGGSVGAGGSNGVGTPTMDATGGSTAHNIMSPFSVVNYIIKT